MSLDYEHTEGPCKFCDHSPLHTRRCDEVGCDEGMMDEYDDDAINYAPGEDLYPCPECKGRGCLTWCPKCGKDQF